jgi:hypothetical protein
MPLTNYLMQTALCTTLFYNWGFGLWAQVGPAAGLALAVASSSGRAGALEPLVAAAPRPRPTGSAVGAPDLRQQAHGAAGGRTRPSGSTGGAAPHDAPNLTLIAVQGTTAVTSISTLARSSTSAATCTADMATV